MANFVDKAMITGTTGAFYYITFHEITSLFRVERSIGIDVILQDEDIFVKFKLRELYSIYDKCLYFT